MKLRKNVLVTPVALATLALVGCGGGDNNNQTAAQPTVQAGQTQTSLVLVDGVEVEKTTYRWYSVADDKGTLTDVPLSKETDEVNLPHVLIAESIVISTPTVAASTNPSVAMAYNLQAPVSLPATLAEYKTCYSQFWQGIQKHYPTADKARVAKRINDFNMTLDELCVKQASSKLSMDEYIELFQVVSRYWPNDPLIEGKIADFFINIRVSPGTFKQTLSGMGYVWEDFARRLKNESTGAVGFANEYQLSALAFESFLRNYMTQHQPGVVVTMVRQGLQKINATLAKSFNPKLQQALRGHKTLAAVDPTVATYVDTANAITDSVQKVFSLGKDVWNFIDTKKAVDQVDDGTKGAGLNRNVRRESRTSCSQAIYELL